MSLLLDALRRAAASKQGPEDDQYVAPRREDSVLEPDADPGADEPARPERDAEPGERDFELSLEPETGDRDEPGGRAGDDPPPEHATPEPGRPTPGPPRATPASRPAATTLLNARGSGGQRHHGHGVLIGVVLFVVVAVALAAGGWWFYQESRRAVDRDLAAYQPTAEPLVELDGEGQAQSSSAGTTVGSDADAATDTGTEGEDTGADEGTAEADTAAADTVETDTVETDRAETDTGDVAAVGGSADTSAAPETESTGEASSPSGNTSKTAAETSTPEPESTQSEPADSASASTSATSTGDAGESAASESGTSAQPARQAQPMVQATGPSLLSRALDAGYAALRAGDLATAEREYRRALSRDRDNRDALLGLASVAQRRGEPEQAANYYQRVLDDRPRDPYARAGLASLAGRIEPRRSETALKRLLRDQPDSPSLHFALGNVYAGESRWGEAQQAYFNAYRAEPDNPEYAYNLAVALDHLEQRQAALEHYRAALAGLDGNAGAGFSAEAVRRRIAQLE